METTVSEIMIDTSDEKKTTCRICCNDLETEQMFSVALCGHLFCVECMKRYVEVELLEGRALRCPYYHECESMMSLISCADLLTPKLREMWERRIGAELIPLSFCSICCNDDLETEEMFSVGLCGHQFCLECVKQYVQVGLREGSVLRCPHYQCESMLSPISCADLLTPKLREKWERRIEEELIPITERVYCPNPKCSVLMSKTELRSEEEEEEEVISRRSCLKWKGIRCRHPHPLYPLLWALLTFTLLVSVIRAWLSKRLLSQALKF